MTGSPRKDARKPSPNGVPRAAIYGVLVAGLVILAIGAVIGIFYRDTARGVAGSVIASAIGGPFTLVDQENRAVTDATLKGKWSMIYFGYTHCPDACPTAINDMALTLDALGADKDKVRAVFVTIDPARDTPEVMKSYVGSFDTPILALTGTEEQVAAAAKAYRVYFAKHPRADGDYDMDHSSVIYVMDPQGRFTATFTHETPPEQMTERMKKLLS